MPVLGLKVLHLSASNLGLLFTSLGAGSVAGAAFVLPWLRTRFSPDAITLSANVLIVLAYAFMALARQAEAAFAAAAVAGMGWTLSASELWVAAQRAMPAWVRGRLNATVMMTSQGAMALGGVIWGSAAAIAGASYTFIGAAVLFLTSLLRTGLASSSGQPQFQEHDPTADASARAARGASVKNSAESDRATGSARPAVMPTTPKAAGCN